MKKVPVNKKIISSCYFLNVVHCLICYIFMYLGIVNGDESIIFLGIILAAMIPLTILDNRKEMSGKKAVWTTLFLHVALDCFIALLSMCYWIAYLSVLETVILIFWRKHAL